MSDIVQYWISLRKKSTILDILAVLWNLFTVFLKWGLFDVVILIFVYMVFIYSRGV
jgi:hypothetical protein